MGECRALDGDRCGPGLSIWALEYRPSAPRPGDVACGHGNGCERAKQGTLAPLAPHPQLSARHGCPEAIPCSTPFELNPPDSWRQDFDRHVTTANCHSMMRTVIATVLVA